MPFLTAIFPEAIGLLLVRFTNGSKSRSAISLRTQPADLITTTPIRKITSNVISTFPSLAIHIDQSIGHISNHMPMGLSNLIKIR